MNIEFITKLKKMARYINILYIEDDRLVSLEFEKLFRKIFGNIDIVYDGFEGIAKYEKGKYDIVIVDIDEIKFDGIEIVRIMKEIDKEQVIVVTSVYDDKKSLLKLIEYGVEKFILKPFDMRKFLQDISKIVYVIYKIKREEQLKDRLKNELKLNQLLVDKMITPIAILNHTSITYTNHKFQELFSLNKGLNISTLFKDKAIFSLNNCEFIEYMQLHSNNKTLVQLSSGEFERFKVNITSLEDSEYSLVCFFNTEIISHEIEKLEYDNRFDNLTLLLNRDSFEQDIEMFLDSKEIYNVLCFGIKNIKEFVYHYGVKNLRDIYKTLSLQLKHYFKDDIKNKDLHLYYFDANHFILVVKDNMYLEIKELLNSFGEKFIYTNDMIKNSEPLSLDILSFQLDKKSSISKNLAEIENKLYMLKVQL